MAASTSWLWLHHSNLCFHLHSVFPSVCLVFLCLSLIRTLVIAFRVHTVKPRCSPTFEILNFIAAGKTLLSNKVTFTGSKNRTWYLWGRFSANHTMKNPFIKPQQLTHQPHHSTHSSDWHSSVYIYKWIPQRFSTKNTAGFNRDVTGAKMEKETLETTNNLSPVTFIH